MRSLQVVFILMLSSAAWASTLSMVGYGARNQALGNSTSALAVDAYSQAYNPALMVFQPHVLVSAGVEGAFTSFERINQVVVDTPALGGSSTQVSDVSTKTPDTFVMVLALQTPLSEGENPWHFGVDISTPVLSILSAETEDTFLPQYTMYLADTQRFNGGFNLAYSPSDRIALGVGSSLYLVQGATSRVRLPAGGNATATLKMDVRPAFAPVAGVVFNFDNKEEHVTHKVSLVYRGKQDYRTEFNFDNTISLIGASDLLFTGKTSLYYDPDTFIAAWGYSKDQNSYALSANLERWSGYTSSAMALTFQSFTGSFNQVLPSVTFKDIVTLHGGIEHRFPDSETALRLGYAFLPTPVPDQSGDTNYLDSDKHQLSMGFGFSIPHGPFGWKSAVDLCGFAQYLVPKQVTKVSSQSIGYPGYKIGGMVYGYGVTLTSGL